MPVTFSSSYGTTASKFCLPTIDQFKCTSGMDLHAGMIALLKSSPDLPPELDISRIKQTLLHGLNQRTKRDILMHPWSTANNSLQPTQPEIPKQVRIHSAQDTINTPLALTSSSCIIVVTPQYLFHHTTCTLLCFLCLPSPSTGSNVVTEPEQVPLCLPLLLVQFVYPCFLCNSAYHIANDPQVSFNWMCNPWLAGQHIKSAC